MLSHADIWRAIDRLAADSGTSPSGLARRAGLDPTTFNRSKRLAAGGRPRWPSTESISKILAATGRSLAEFANPGSGGRRLPLIPGDRVADGGCFDAQGLPAGGGWAEIEFPGIGDPHAYAMRVVDDARAPVYRPGDTIVLGPRSAARVGEHGVDPALVVGEGEVAMGVDHAGKVARRDSSRRMQRGRCRTLVGSCPRATSQSQPKVPASGS